MVSELLDKYLWLVRKFVTAGERGMDLEEISDAWYNKFGTDYARRTFNNHREAVKEIFGITIACNRSTNRYYIPHSEDVADADAGTAWLIDTFTVNNLLTLGKERLSGRVSVEDIPSGRQHLTVLMNAMQENNIIEITYRKYEEKATKRRIRPYAVKESALRWYLIGYSEESDRLKVYSLDRILKISVLPDTFRMPENFDVDELFATSFRTYLSEDKGITITFRAFGKEVSFIRDLPIHNSQKELSFDGNSALFSIFVTPNNALYLEFLSHGPKIEVMSPPEIRRKIGEMAGEMNELYKTRI